MWNCAHGPRQQLTAIRNDDVHESFVAAFINEEVTPSKWLRLDLGGRVDLFVVAVDSHFGQRRCRGGPSVESKTSLVVTPNRIAQRATLDFYLKLWSWLSFQRRARSFRAMSGHAAYPRRGRRDRHARAPVGALGSGGCLWQLDLDNETVWDGDNGTTAVSGATTRRGVEFETRYEFTSWLAAIWT